MKSPATDEFYVGYHKRAPAALASVVRRNVVVLLGLAAVTAVVLTAAQEDFGFGTYEFGRGTVLEGLLQESPYPALLVLRPGVQGGASRFSRYLLVQEGKFGAQAATRGLDGHRVRVSGALIYRDGRTLLELAPKGITEAGPAQAGDSGGTGLDLGVHTLRGEIVDSKCFLGVMNPGNLKTHKSCAIRCISGGIPPVLLSRDESGRAVYLLLVSAAGESVNRAVLPFVAEPVEITGRVRQQDDLLVLHADPETYQILPHRNRGADTDPATGGAL